jgi:hypothetical protein
MITIVKNNIIFLLKDMLNLLSFYNKEEHEHKALINDLCINITETFLKIKGADLPLERSKMKVKLQDDKLKTMIQEYFKKYELEQDDKIVFRNSESELTFEVISK